MKKIYRFMISNILLCGMLLLITACGPTVNQIKAQATVTINKSFQKQTTPAPKVPTYRCGAWTITNNPGAYSTITINARLIKSNNTDKSNTPVEGAPATGVVHFSSGDVPLDAQPTSDTGGYVAFTLALMGRQTRLVPATVDVYFTVDGKALQCTPAFFTPQ